MIKNYVMYGYNLADENDTGYFGKNLQIVTDINAAMLFPNKPRKNKRGFGSPQQWLDFLNDPNEKLNHGFKFHLVMTNL